MAKSPPQLATLILMSIWGVLSLNMFLPALPSMAQSFGVSYATISLAVSGYMYLTGGLLLVIGPISDIVGRRRTTLAAAAIFVVASLGTILATRFEVFMIFRLLQGVAVGGFSLSQAAIRDTTDSQEQAASRIAIVAMVMAIGPMLAPMVGGLLDVQFGWRAIFIALCALGMAVLGFCYFDMGETRQGGGMSFRERVQGYRSLLSTPHFWGYAIAQAFALGMFFAFLTGMPLLGQRIFGMTPSHVGLMLGLLPLGYIAGNFYTNRKTRQLGLVSIMERGRLVGLAAVGSAMLVVALGVTNPWLIFAPLVLCGSANGLTMAPSNAGAVSINPRLAGTAAGLMGAMSTATGASIASLTALIMARSPNTMTLLIIMLTCTLLSGVGVQILRWLKGRSALNAS